MGNPKKLLIFIVVAITLLLLASCTSVQQRENCTDYNFGYTFRDALEYTPMGSMFTHQNEAILRVRQNEVSEMLLNIDFVDTAKVELSLHDAPVSFAQALMPVTAAVYINSSRALTTEDDEIIALMVSRMVSGLPTENVSIINENTYNHYGGETKPC